MTRSRLRPRATGMERKQKARARPRRRPAGPGPRERTPNQSNRTQKHKSAPRPFGWMSKRCVRVRACVRGACVLLNLKIGKGRRAFARESNRIELHFPIRRKHINNQPTQLKQTKKQMCLRA